TAVPDEGRRPLAEQGVRPRRLPSRPGLVRGDGARVAAGAGGGVRGPAPGAGRLAAGRCDAGRRTGRVARRPGPAAGAAARPPGGRGAAADEVEPRRRAVAGTDAA